LPQSKAQSLGKKGRASAASRKRREDPNPERSGPAINVNTKKEKKVTEMDKSQLAAGTDQQFSVQQLATISDEALDNAYGYGRSSPGNTFGWQANLKSAAYAKHMIDKGITDIDEISDAIHKGWNVTAKAFVQNPERFDDTEKLKAAGKLEAKLQQRAKLMNIDYSQLPDDEQEKDRVVARALLQALKGKQGVAEVSNNALKSYQQKVSSDSMKHKADPTKRSPEKANRSVAGFAKAQNRSEQGVAEGLKEKEYIVIASMGENDYELEFRAKTPDGALMQAKKWQKQNHIREVHFTVKEKGVAEGKDPEKRARLDDLVSMYRDSTDPSDYYDSEYEDPEEVLNMIRAEFGNRVASQIEAGTDKMHFPRKDHDQGYDPMSWRKPVDRQTKAGKMYKQDSDYRKNTIKARYRNSGKSATEGVVEGDVVPFPKKHPYELLTNCPKCGGLLQGGKDEKGRLKMCIPCMTLYRAPIQQGMTEGNGRGLLWIHDKHGNEIRKGTVLKNTRTGKTGPATGMSSQAGKTHLTIKAHDDSYWDTHDNYEVVKKKQGVAKGLKEMDNRTPSGDRREKRNNSPEEKAKQDKEQQKRLTATSPEMRKKLRLPEPKQGVAENKLPKPYKKWAS
jgi:hypothetical protein